MIHLTTEVLRAAERVREKCQVRTVYAKDKQIASELKPAGAPMPTQHHKHAAHMAMRPRVQDLLDKGASKAEISRVLGISVSQVKRHAQAIKGGKPDWNSHPQPIEVDGVRYESMREALTALGIGTTLMYKWLKAGKAKKI